jgi:hypothetical protein
MRTDHLLARTLLDIVQTYYTEERLMYITTDSLRRKVEPYTVNQVTPEGEIVNDLTLGEYDIVVTSQPERDTLEDSTFAQIMEMRKELGVQIPDSVFIQNSRIANKSQVIEAIEAQANSPAVQQQQQLEMERQQAEIRKINSDAARDETDAQSKQIQAQQDALNMSRPITPDVQLRVQADLASHKYQVDTNAQLEREKMQIDLEKERMRLASAKRKEPTKEKSSGGRKARSK